MKKAVFFLYVNKKGRGSFRKKTRTINACIVKDRSERASL